MMVCLQPSEVLASHARLECPINICCSGPKPTSAMCWPYWRGSAPDGPAAPYRHRRGSLLPARSRRSGDARSRAQRVHLRVVPLFTDSPGHPRVGAGHSGHARVGSRRSPCAARVVRPLQTGGRLHRKLGRVAGRSSNWRSRCPACDRRSAGSSTAASARATADASRAPPFQVHRCSRADSRAFVFEGASLPAMDGHLRRSDFSKWIARVLEGNYRRGQISDMLTNLASAIRGRYKFVDGASDEKPALAAPATR